MVSRFLIPLDELKPILTNHGVSEKETKALILALEGKPHHEIAEKLDIMPDAARKRLGEIYKKFGLTGRGSGKLAKLQQLLLAEYQNRKQNLSTQVENAQNRSLEGISSAIDWAIPPTHSQFFGREDKVEKLQSNVLKVLEDKPEDKKSLIAIVGLKGIGKTAFVTKVVEDIKKQSKFDLVSWQSLDSNYSLPFKTILGEYITHVRHRPLSLGEDCLEAIMGCFREHRCLLILDGLDFVLSPPQEDSSEKKEDSLEKKLLGDLLRRVGTERHLSGLILTSQEKPKEVEELEKLNYPVFSLFLEGLDEEDAQKLLKTKEPELEDESAWPKLIKIFEGNPLALQLISVSISRFFGGSVTEFLTQETISCTRIDELLDSQYQSLSKKEKDVLSLLATEGKSLKFKALKEKLGYRGSELLSILESLVRRSLLKGETQFEIQPIVKKYITRSIH